MKLDPKKYHYLGRIQDVYDVYVLASSMRKMSTSKDIDSIRKEIQRLEKLLSL